MKQEEVVLQPLHKDVAAVQFQEKALAQVQVVIIQPEAEEVVLLIITEQEVLHHLQMWEKAVLQADQVPVAIKQAHLLIHHQEVVL